MKPQASRVLSFLLTPTLHIKNNDDREAGTVPCMLASKIIENLGALFAL